MMKYLKLNRILLLGSMFAMTLAIPAAAESYRDPPPRGGHHMRLMEEIDVDNNGTITRVEIDTVQQQRFSEFDGDKSGTLSLNEFEELWLQRMRHRMVDKFQRLDEDGDGQVTRAEFDAPFNNMMARRDQNNDGVLSQDELRSRKRGRRRQNDPPPK